MANRKGLAQPVSPFLATPAKLTLSISIRPNRRWALRTFVVKNYIKSYPRAFQISVAYSRIVRSDENQPIRAVLSTAERHHSFESCQ